MHEPIAVTPWELEAERRREVITADVRAARQRAPRAPDDAVLPSRLAFSPADRTDRRAEAVCSTHPVGQALVPGK